MYVPQVFLRISGDVIVPEYSSVRLNIRGCKPRR